jgi:hypothetical protein
MSQRRHRFLALAAALLLLALALPWLLWFYHLAVGGSMLERGLTWPTPRQADSLPALADQAALQAAANELEQAQRWRPKHPQAYRLEAYAAMAAGDWAEAARQLDTARALAPRQPLLAWEAGLAYEQLWLAAPQDRVLEQQMLAAWRAAGFDAAALETRALEARLGNRPAEAERWQRRAAIGRVLEGQKRSTKPHHRYDEQ